jgi:hypothetical protein
VRSFRFFIALATMAISLSAQAAIPDSERNVLLALYASTNGSGWYQTLAGMVLREPNAVGTACLATARVRMLSASNSAATFSWELFQRLAP